ncbi:MAG: NUDIX domain-containing protein [Armatimonadia bacterium]|nr:NUDIX domain-containing protein [Armatimonadia bacterium]
MSGSGKSNSSSMQTEALYNTAGYSMCARGLLQRQGEVLLTLEGHDRMWRLPGGTVGPRETPVEALRRMMLMALGIDVEPVSFIGVTHSPRDCSVQLVFEVRPVDGWNVDPDGDAVLHAMWFRDHALPANICESARSVIEAAGGINSGPFLVTHGHDDTSIWQP